MRALCLLALVSCTSPRTATPPPPAQTVEAPVETCPNGQVSLFLRDDATHCAWACDPEDDDPCPTDFACVGVGRTRQETIQRYCETLKGAGISDGVDYPPEWRPKKR